MTAIRDEPRVAPCAPCPPASTRSSLRQTTASVPLGHDVPAVLDITEWYGATSGGIRTYLDEKARYLASRRDTHHPWRQVLVVPGAESSMQEVGATRRYVMAGPRIPGHAPYRLLLNLPRVQHIMAEESPAIVEVGSPLLVPWLMHAARLWLRRSIPIVHMYHAHVPQLFGPRGMQELAWRYVRRLHDIARCTIVTSVYAQRALEARGLTRLVHVPLGVDLAMFTPARRAHAAQTRRRWGLVEAPFAAYVGRFAREKSLDVLLDAWPAIERETGMRLVLMGAGPDEHRLRAHRAARHVTVLPFAAARADVADLMAASACLIAPGHKETFGLTALEALASGVPVVSAYGGGVVEQVLASGAGALFTPGDVDALADAVRTVCSGDRGTWMMRARAYAEAEHGWDTVFGRLFNVYQQVCAS